MLASNNTANKMAIKKQIRKRHKKKHVVHFDSENQDTGEQQRLNSMSISNDNMEYLLQRYQSYISSKRYIQGLPQVSAQIIPKCMIGSEGMKLFGDLQITADGIVRQYSALSSVCFGFSQLQGESIEYLRDCNIIDLQFHSGLGLPTCCTDQAIRFLYHVPNSVDLSMLLKQIEVKVNAIKQQLGSIQISDEFLMEKERQFREFKNRCMEYLKTRSSKERIENQINQNHQEANKDGGLISYCGSSKDEADLPQNERSSDNRSNNMECQKPSENNITQSFPPLEMFSYAIGRLSHKDKDIEIVNVGYSKGYLDFLGLDINSLTSIALRQKRIDLIYEGQGITDISANDLLKRMILRQNTQFKSNIVTFDGFQIPISQTTKNIQLPIIQSKFDMDTINCEYLFIVTEIDVDTYDLQNLIEYRRQLSQQPNSLSIENFIKRELSYKFEDVEYSVQSESFLSRFYENNLKALRQMEVEKQQQQNQGQQGISSYRMIQQEEQDKNIDEL